jgi:uncharacterized protein (DUF427 family)
MRTGGSNGLVGVMARRRLKPDAAGEGQESVWDYPRPPALVASARHVVIRLGAILIVDSRRALRVLETSHPPGWYVPRDDVVAGVLRPSSSASTVCEWKGTATYWDVVTPDVVLPAAMWSYQRPTPRFTALCGAVSGYPSQLDCTVDGERVRSQEGSFYGGWITSDVVGPFKGAPGTWGW